LEKIKIMSMRRTFVLGFFAAAAMSAPAVAESNYDGLWNVTILTSAGSCNPTAQYPLTVSDGHVTGPGNVSGSVARSGGVRVSISGAYANGTLSGNAGSGRWNSASAGMPCSGRWVAARQ
jgi:hypothetical protein